MKPSRIVMADTGRSNGKVMRRNFCHPVAPSMAAASSMFGGMVCRPLYRITRLNGMPIQMFAMVTDTRDHCGAVSQLTGPMPRPCSSEFTTPESLLSIHDQVEADT